MQAIINGRIVLPNKVVDGCVLLFGENIEDIIPVNEIPVDETIEIIDAMGNFVTPGFINVHIHGCAGFDTMDATEKTLDAMRRILPQTGVTSFLPTTMTCSFIDMNKVLENIRVVMGKEDEGAKVLGCHLEGPFISEKYKGA